MSSRQKYKSSSVQGSWSILTEGLSEGMLGIDHPGAFAGNTDLLVESGAIRVQESKGPNWESKSNERGKGVGGSHMAGDEVHQIPCSRANKVKSSFNKYCRS